MLLAVSASAGQVIAQEKREAPREKTEAKPEREAKPSDDGKTPQGEGKKAKSEDHEGKNSPAKPNNPAITQHEIKLGERSLSYTATAGTLTLTKSGGEPRANVFYTAYTLGKARKNPKSKSKEGDAQTVARPVTFCFNGGPGSSSVWLHLGAFGPRRVVLADGGLTAPKPPFQLTDNEFTLLESTDLVFIDPVGTGYSKAEKGEDAKQFHGYNEDVESVGDFIRLYVSKNHRWQSPKFLMGESYGAIRAAGLAGHLQQRYGMSLNGIVIVSGLLDFQTLDADETNDLAFICFLPAMTATAAYHQKLDPQLLKDRLATLKAAEAFAHGDYASALLHGAALSAERKNQIAGELAKFIGLPKDLILRENLRIAPQLFFRKLLETENQVIGRFDGRVVGDVETGDPSYGVIFGPFASTLNAYVRGELKVENDQPYEILSGQVRPWNYQPFINRYLNVAGTLNETMKVNPSLKVYVASGHYDLATPPHAIRHSFNHMTLDAKLRSNVQYGYFEGGHMMYTNLPELEKLTRELHAFIKAAK